MHKYNVVTLTSRLKGMAGLILCGFFFIHVYRKLCNYIFLIITSHLKLLNFSGFFIFFVRSN